MLGYRQAGRPDKMIVAAHDASILRPSNPPSVPYRGTTLPLVEQAYDTRHRFRCQNEQSAGEAVVDVVHQVGQIEHAYRDERVVHRTAYQAFHRHLTRFRLPEPVSHCA
jgi:hypothetical protein